MGIVFLLCTRIYATQSIENKVLNGTSHRHPVFEQLTFRLDFADRRDRDSAKTETPKTRRGSSVDPLMRHPKKALAATGSLDLTPGAIFVSPYVHAFCHEPQPAPVET